MKAIFVSLFALIFLQTAVSAQVKTTDKAVISTPGVTCDFCKDKVEQALFKQYGILSYTVDVKKHTTSVAWVTDRTDIEQIKTMIANAGFDADDIAAEESAKKRVPVCCRN